MKIMLTYIDSEEGAERIASALLEEKLVACVNIFPCRSRYWWKGKLERAEEWVVMAKTGEDLVDATMRKVSETHSYAQPVIEVLDVERVNEGVEAWIDEVTR